MKNSLLYAIFFSFSVNVFSQESTTYFFNRLDNESVTSKNSIIWKQVGPGNAGFANLMRYHPTIPGLVAQCPDMFNMYQSSNNGNSWNSIKNYDNNGSFIRLRDLYYSPKDPNFGLAIETSSLWKTTDLGKTWTNIPNCPWYWKDSDGFDRSGWKSKVGSLAIDPNDTNIWFVGGGKNVRGQTWTSCYRNATAAAPHGPSVDYEGRLWRTKDGGGNWELVNSGLDPRAQIGRIIVNPKNSQQVFASSNYGLYRSNDGGSTWNNISSGQLDNEIVIDMDFYYNATTGKFTLYAIDQVQYLADGTSTKCTGGIFKSSNNGNTWTNITGDLGLDINQLTGGVPHNYYKYISKWFGITTYRAKVNYPDLPERAIQNFNMISADPSREGALYIGFSDPQLEYSFMPGRLWTTNNDGANWINTARLTQYVWEADKDYWISRGNPYHKNMSVGHESSHMQYGNNYALRSMRALDVGVDGSVMIVSDHSTMLSKDHGLTWKQVDEDYTIDGSIIGRGNSNLPALYTAQDQRYENPILASGEHRLWIPTNDSPDQRQALKHIKSAQETINTIAFDPYDSKTLYATSSRQAKKQDISKSTDGGLTWSKHGTATPATNAWGDDFLTNALTIDPIDNKYFYFGITKIKKSAKQHLGGFYYSNDYGKTFSVRNTGLPSPARIEDIVFDPRDDSRKSLFIAAEKNVFSQNLPISEGGLYHSKNRGETWDKVNTPSTVLGVNRIVIDQTNRMYITTGYRGGGDGVWYTDDFGLNWTHIFKYARAEHIAVSPYNHNLLLISIKHLALNPGVYFSKDRGLTWEKNNTNLAAQHRVEDIRFDLKDPSEIWLALNGSGFYKGKLISIGNLAKAIDVFPNVVEYSNTTDNLQLNARITQSKYSSEKIKWKSDNPSIATVDQDGLITPLKKGNVKIWATILSDEKYSDYATVVIKDIPVLSNSSLEKEKSDIKISPNPFSDKINVYLPKHNDKNMMVKIFSPSGHIVQNKKYTVKNDYIKINNLDLLDKGVYFISISNSSLSFFLKGIRN